jgi:NAD(P)-dependent dehydrogenase (short-subunit alcohol dehydrogenase family)
MIDISNFIITGASSDVGAAISQYLDAHTDASLILVSHRNPAPSLRRDHIRLVSIDLTDPSRLDQLRNTAKNHFKSPFAVIHCVGDFWTHKPLVRTEFAEIERMITSHYLTLCGVAWALLPLLIENGGGRVVALSCNSVAYNYPDMAPFTAAKAALESFIKCIANEYSEFNVVANSIALPTLRTEKVERLKDGGDLRHYVQPDELAKLIVETIVSAPNILNGNTLKIFRHSPTFFNESYFQRNPRALDIVPLPGSSTRPK